MTAHTHSHQHSHPHPHSHEAGHDHSPRTEAANPEAAQLGPTGPGSVILDIGGDWGSLMIMAPVELAGAEIEISPVGRDDARTHIAIRERQVPAGTRWAGIFPRLLAGRYTVWNLDGSPREVITVAGGHVAELFWT